jgi:hypothetical protein
MSFGTRLQSAKVSVARRLAALAILPPTLGAIVGAAPAGTRPINDDPTLQWNRSIHSQHSL